MSIQISSHCTQKETTQVSKMTTWAIRIIVLCTVILALVVLVTQTGGTYSQDSLKHLEKYSHLEKLLKKIQPSPEQHQPKKEEKSRGSSLVKKERVVNKPHTGDEVVSSTSVTSTDGRHGDRPEVKPNKAESRERKKHKKGGLTSESPLSNLDDLHNFALNLGILGSAKIQPTDQPNSELSQFELPAPKHNVTYKDIKAKLAKSGEKPHRHKAKNRNARHQTNNRTRPRTTSDIEVVAQHMTHVNRHGACKIPSVHVVRVQEFYPTPGVMYMPQCVLLHQCRRDSGCCHESLTCGPKETQIVELPFYVVRLHNGSRGVITNLTFENHTECECQDQIGDIMPREQERGPRNGSLKMGRYSSHLVHYSPPKDFPKSSNHSNKLQHCTCPAEMSPRLNSARTCSCDCFMDQRTCLRIQKGLDKPSATSRWCIRKNVCQKPSCLYGNYMDTLERCPRKSEQDTTWVKVLEGL